ncbi:hypothetical protein [Pseudoalteromonas umbrosa]|uniref:hypothetical protein n=1 Tax=Pseudoalteromonas umbrosa TaxID=3048489 RepID=UPI0024C32D4F|nr:hypothetical protein [Pseudoalteromonas sp. B95]MDK1290249.1 hypothetical protein [Pseudoalteromonas sp. B95]
MNTMKNDNLEIVTGEAHIQELADLILDNKLYMRENTLNYLISVTGKEKSVADYQRYVRYSLLMKEGKPVALCMLVEQRTGEVIEEDKGLHYFTNCFYSIFVVPEHRGKGFADMVARSLAENWNTYFRETFMTKYNRYCIMGDLRGAAIARKYFNIPIVCGEFPIWEGLRRVVAIVNGEPQPENLEVDTIFLDTAETINAEFKLAYEQA